MNTLELELQKYEQIGWNTGRDYCDFLGTTISQEAWEVYRRFSKQESIFDDGEINETKHAFLKGWRDALND